MSIAHHDFNPWRAGILSLLAVMLAWHGWQAAQPRQYPEAPSGQFNCLSYTPASNRSQGPADLRAQIDHDLAQLSQRTGCVRTYSVINGLDYVPEAARRFHMRVLVGVWIGSSTEANEIELQRVVEVANRHRDVIDAIVVGNEVLLRREQTPEAMMGYLQRVKQTTQLPVTYADVWDFWLKNPQLAQVADFVTIHILPYWDDLPIGIDYAMAHVAEIYNKVQGAFPGRHIYVGEVGWPSEGRQREAAKPSLHNQARFTREFIAFASERQIPYNFIEAYDQPWKKGLEGTVGGYWGLYDAKGNAKFPLTGPVVDATHDWRTLLLMAVVALALLVWGWSRSPATGGMLALLGACASILWVYQWDYLQTSVRNLEEALAMGAFTVVSNIAVLTELLRNHERAERWRGFSWVVLSLMLAYINLGLVFDARYRDFPSVFLLLPSALLLTSRWQVAARWQGPLLMFGLWLCVSAPVIALLEKITNTSALLWCALCLVSGLRLVWLTLGDRRLHQIQHAQQ